MVLQDRSDMYHFTIIPQELSSSLSIGHVLQGSCNPVQLLWCHCHAMWFDWCAKGCSCAAVQVHHFTSKGWEIVEGLSCAAGEIWSCIISLSYNNCYNSLGSSASTHHVLQGNAILYTLSMIQQGLGVLLTTHHVLQGDCNPVHIHYHTTSNRWFTESFSWAAGELQSYTQSLS